MPDFEIMRPISHQESEALRQRAIDRGLPNPTWFIDGQCYLLGEAMHEWAAKELAKLRP